MGLERVAALVRRAAADTGVVAALKDNPGTLAPSLNLTPSDVEAMQSADALSGPVASRRLTAAQEAATAVATGTLLPPMGSGVFAGTPLAGPSLPVGTSAGHLPRVDPPILSNGPPPGPTGTSSVPHTPGGPPATPRGSASANAGPPNQGVPSPPGDQPEPVGYPPGAGPAEGETQTFQLPAFNVPWCAPADQGCPCCCCCCAAMTAAVANVAMTAITAITAMTVE